MVAGSGSDILDLWDLDNLTSDENSADEAGPPRSAQGFIDTEAAEDRPKKKHRRRATESD